MLTLLLVVTNLLLLPSHGLLALDKSIAVHFYKRHRFEFFFAKESVADASQSCRNEGSRLVEIHTKEVNKFLENLLSDGKKELWTGGKGTFMDWKWNEGAKVTLDFGWQEDRPKNEPTENCLLATSTGWKNFGCHNQVGYICEQMQVSEVKISPKQVHVHDSGSYRISCTANSLPIADVRWFFGTKEVASSSATRIYQTKESGKATLNLQKAKVSDEGNYTCNATNVIDGNTTSVTDTATVRVLSRPNIEMTQPNNCNSSLTVIWTPHHRAVGVIHRITVTEKDKEEEIFNKDTVPHKRTQNVIDGLSFSTSYNVRITPCPNECKTNYSVVKTGNTSNLPGPVTDITATPFVMRNCKITWTSPTGNIGPITGYQITTKRHSNSAAFEIDETDTFNITESKYVKPGRPNSKYEFGIEAWTCAGLGPITWSAECVTDNQAPDTVQSPITENAIESSGRVSITVSVPSQENGSLSCLFVVVKLQAINSTEHRISNLDNLKAANSSYFLNSTTEYIAIALDTERMTAMKINAMLGAGEITSCIVTNTTGRTRRSASSYDQMIFIGRNNQLDPKRNYSVYVVSATHSRNGLLLKSSEVKKIVGSERLQKTNELIAPIIAVIFSVVIVFILVATFILWKRRRNKSNQAQPTPIRQENTTQQPVNCENSKFMKKKEIESSTGIKLLDYEKTYNKMMLNGEADFIKQFENLNREASLNIGPTAFASNPELKRKNRYKNILPFDHSRVKIKNNDTGYINACYVDGFKQKQKFIAAQGPLPGTLIDFWLMIAEQKCSIIVMLAKCIEAGKKKCEKYWPDYQQSVQFGPVTIKNREEVVFAGFVRRILSVSAELPGENISFDACQYHFTKWPDHGIPPTTSYLARMHREAMQTHSTRAIKSPMVVHCSAGAGRTGTFIAYDILRSESEEKNRIDPYSCVTNMRAQRVDMVQNCDQYILVHKLLLENFLFKDTDLTAAEATGKYADDEYIKNVAELQFKSFSRIRPMAVTTNRSGEKISPYVRMKVTLDDPSETGESSNVDASYIETDDSNKVIAATDPTENSARNFWKLIVEQRVAVIVSLTDHEKQAYAFWPTEVNSVENFGNVSVKLQDIQLKQRFQIKKFSVSYEHMKVEVTQLQFDVEESVFSSKMARNFVELAKEMQKESRDSSSRVILIHCRDGSGITGTFCAVVNAIERLKLENRVDIFRTVKDLRDCREGMVKTKEQYLFCHQVVIDYLSSFDIYSNFK